MIPKTDHAKPCALKTLCAFFVAHIFSMLSAVDLDDKLCFQTDEIDDELLYWPLAPELCDSDLPVANALPKVLFDICRETPKLFRLIST